MYVCMYVCVYIYIYYIYTSHTYIHTYIHTYSTYNTYNTHILSVPREAVKRFRRPGLGLAAFGPIDLPSARIGPIVVPFWGYLIGF